MKSWLPSFVARTTEPIAIRTVSRLDLEAIVDIDKQHSDNPWSLLQYCEFLRIPNAGAIVAQRSSQTVGFALFFPKKRAWQIQVMVHDQHVRQGIGRHLVTYFMERLHERHRPQLVALVREQNLRAQLFFKAMRFQATGTYRAHGHLDKQDQYFFRYRVGS